ncbi:hypothetical protein Afil01_38760 [Actinorhabdospora filicis]|uniref:Uncharacterized protein n=1 Tax=Actinorhabdospora filicis TaxID=1785913 RepID=A0A9W6W9W8_9ACTN|nr:hypothetical protein Afil01_38760 [Actinorhabdospora filicis]
MNRPKALPRRRDASCEVPDPEVRSGAARDGEAFGVRANRRPPGYPARDPGCPRTRGPYDPGVALFPYEKPCRAVSPAVSRSRRRCRGASGRDRRAAGSR